MSKSCVSTFRSQIMASYYSRLYATSLIVLVSEDKLSFSCGNNCCFYLHKLSCQLNDVFKMCFYCVWCHMPYAKIWTVICLLVAYAILDLILGFFLISERVRWRWSIFGKLDVLLWSIEWNNRSQNDEELCMSSAKAVSLHRIVHNCVMTVNSFSMINRRWVWSGELHGMGFWQFREIITRKLKTYIEFVTTRTESKFWRYFQSCFLPRASSTLPVYYYSSRAPPQLHPQNNYSSKPTK
jgi:hypothetical protein